MDDVRALLDEVDDTLEIVLRRLDRRGEAWDVWHDARDEASAAYATWRRRGGPEAHAVYRAAQDRADAAQDALAELEAATFA